MRNGSASTLLHRLGHTVQDSRFPQCSLQVEPREAFVLPWKVLTEAARCFVQQPAAPLAGAAATPLRLGGGLAAAGTPATRELLQMLPCCCSGTLWRHRCCLLISVLLISVLLYDPPRPCPHLPACLQLLAPLAAARCAATSPAGPACLMAACPQPRRPLPPLRPLSAACPCWTPSGRRAWRRSCRQSWWGTPTSPSWHRLDALAA